MMRLVMQMNYIMVIIATVLLAFDFALSKKYQSSEGTGMAAGLKFNMLNGLFTAAIFLALSGFKAEFSLFSALMALAMSLCSIAYSVIGFRILKSGGMALYSIFLMLGGMLLPYLFGVLFLDEPLTLMRVVGVLLIIAAVICSGRAKYDVPPIIYLLCFAVFVLNGCVSVISKCHQIGTVFSPVDSTAFVMYSGITKFLVSSTALLVCGKKSITLSFSAKSAGIAVLCSAVIGGISYMLQLIGAKELPATVLYPIVTGGSILFSALSGRVFFKEKLSAYQIISIALCFVGTLLFL